MARFVGLERHAGAGVVRLVARADAGGNQGPLRHRRKDWLRQRPNRSQTMTDKGEETVKARGRVQAG